MIDMQARLGAVIVFSTTSNDYRAKVVGPQINQILRSGDPVPTAHAGLHTVVVVDRQLRHVDVRLKAADPTTADPSDAPRDHDEMVTVTYEIRS